MLQPFICTCSKRPETFRIFVKSYLENAKDYLKRPIIYYDGNEKEYHDLIDSLNPIEKIEQSSVVKDTKGKTIDYKCVWEFPEIIKQKYSKDYILFIEDDILFSSKFGEAIQKSEEYMKRYGGVALITFYGHQNEYNPQVHNKANWYFYKFSGYKYQGNLAVIFRPELMDWWYKNRSLVWGNKQCGWDWKIGKVFEKNKFRFYCTHWHYVQHQISTSAISGYVKKEYSKRFIQ